MTKGKIFQCEVTVSSGVKDKLLRKHGIQIWEIEEIIYDDPNAFTLSYQDGHFVYGQTFPDDTFWALSEYCRTKS